MAPIVTAPFRFPTAASRWRRLLAGLVAASLLLSGAAYAANQSVQGAKKPVEDGGYDTDAPTAILIEAGSGSILFEKNADELRQPSSMAKLMTAELVFSMLARGDIKLTDEYRVSENAWRKGGAPAGGATMFAALKSAVPVSDLLRGMIVQNGNDSAMILAEGIAGNEKAFAEKLTARARELGMAKSNFANSMRQHARQPHPLGPLVRQMQSKFVVPASPGRMITGRP